MTMKSLLVKVGQGLLGGLILVGGPLAMIVWHIIQGG